MRNEHTGIELSVLDFRDYSLGEELLVNEKYNEQKLSNRHIERCKTSSSKPRRGAAKIWKYKQIDEVNIGVRLNSSVPFHYSQTEMPVASVPKNQKRNDSVCVIVVDLSRKIMPHAICVILFLNMHTYRFVLPLHADKTLSQGVNNTIRIPALKKEDGENQRNSIILPLQEKDPAIVIFFWEISEVFISIIRTFPTKTKREDFSFSAKSISRLTIEPFNFHRTIRRLHCRATQHNSLCRSNRIEESRNKEQTSLITKCSEFVERKYSRDGEGNERKGEVARYGKRKGEEGEKKPEIPLLRVRDNPTFFWRGCNFPDAEFPVDSRLATQEQRSRMTNTGQRLSVFGSVLSFGKNSTTSRAL
ncbi:hypothetical protein EAG_13911 [Camponotus floridanus]|uniref:Uncharacterized protein n=1 Tax=Camponotus floridanus TaxID=104421 RepID=E2ABB4_CAMFO|nr:hypothetical protein EAG_13911 [Camponotus floridanus]